MPSCVQKILGLEGTRGPSSPAPGGARSDISSAHPRVYSGLDVGVLPCRIWEQGSSLGGLWVSFQP